ncbi:hypothetical protein F5Y11DRAFT_194390 [Daldinia sp. FL1419]|nr:hypothetical protein F5Y11DRAFT_194390 [Daldinia sp. FL1419]
MVWARDWSLISIVLRSRSVDAGRFTVLPLLPYATGIRTCGRANLVHSICTPWRNAGTGGKMSYVRRKLFGNVELHSRRSSSTIMQRASIVPSMRSVYKVPDGVSSLSPATTSILRTSLLNTGVGDYGIAHRTQLVPAAAGTRGLGSGKKAAAASGWGCGTFRYAALASWIRFNAAVPR